MRIRQYEPTDLRRLQDLHGDQEYDLPDPNHPLVLVGECGVDECGQIRVAGIARMELNVTLLLDHNWSTPHARMEAIRMLQGEMHKKAAALGLDWAYAEAGHTFGKRLEDLGWIPAKNRLYFLRIN